MIDDPVTGDDAQALTATSLNLLQTVGIDLSALTGDGSPTVAMTLLGAEDDDGDDAGHEFVGTDFDDTVNLSDYGDTVTGGEGDDTFPDITGGSGSDTFIVDEDTDTIVGLTAEDPSTSDPEQDVLVVESGATAEAFLGSGEVFFATADTVNDGAATITAGTLGASTIDVSEAGGSDGFTLTASVNAVGENGNKTLIGSDNDDVINGGDSLQVNANRIDTLTGNGGADLFEFNIATSDTADLEENVVEAEGPILRS